MISWRAVMVLVGSLLVASACRVDATTTITVAEDGSGTVAVEVVLDADAFERVADLDAQLRVDDLEAAGWEVSGPDPTDDQGRRILATKPFADPEEAATVLAEVTGPHGALLEAIVGRSKGFAQVQWQFEATLDLSGGIEAFGDSELTELLAGLPIGQDVITLEEELGAPLADLTSFTVVVDLPAGDVSTSGDPQVSELDERSVFIWEGSLGDPPVELSARSREVDWLVIGLAALAVAAGLMLAVMSLRRLAGRRRPTRVAADA